MGEDLAPHPPGRSVWSPGNTRRSNPEVACSDQTLVSFSDRPGVLLTGVRGQRRACGRECVATVAVDQTEVAPQGKHDEVLEVLVLDQLDRGSRRTSAMIS
jgi:hypothetical protein